jgi:hypothetical protein
MMMMYHPYLHPLLLAAHEREDTLPPHFSIDASTFLFTKESTRFLTAPCKDFFGAWENGCTLKRGIECGFERIIMLFGMTTRDPGRRSSYGYPRSKGRDT